MARLAPGTTAIREPINIGGREDHPLFGYGFGLRTKRSRPLANAGRRVLNWKGTGTFPATGRSRMTTSEGAGALTISDPSSPSARGPTSPAGPRRVRPRAVAAAQQLEPVGGAVRGVRLCGPHARVAGRPDTVEEAAAHPEAFAHKSIGQVADHFETIIRGPDQKSAVIGHSFGGLLTQILAGRGLARVSVAIDPAPFRGVL